MPAHPTLFLRRSIYQQHGLFDLHFKIAADYDFMLRILKSDLKIDYLPKILYKMRIGGESNKSLKNIIRKSQEDFHAIKKNRIGGIEILLLKNLTKIKQFIKKNYGEDK
jgi:glycosyltransferase